MTHYDLETLIREVRVNGTFVPLLQELFEIGRANLEDKGADLLLAIKIDRGLSIEEMSKATNISLANLNRLLNKQMGISKIAAKKLEILGYPSAAFLRK